VHLSVMFRKLEQLLILLLVLSSTTFNEVSASSGPSSGPTTCQARYYPFAREYRRKIQEKIEESTQNSSGLLDVKRQFRLSWNAPSPEDPGKGRWLFGRDPTNLLMSLQP
jgi:hypothetical protein